MVQAKIKYLDILWYHRWFAASLFVVVLVMVTAVTVSLPKVYQVDSEIYIEPKPNTVTGDAVNFNDYDYRVINNQVEILGSDTVAKTAAARIRNRLGKNYPVSRDLLQSGLKIAKKDYTNVIELSLTSAGKPAELQVMLGEYLGAYMQTLKAINSDKARAESHFLKGQLQEAEKNLALASAKLQAYQAEHQAYAPSEQTGQLLSLASHLDVELATVAADRAAAGKQVTASRKHLPASAEYITMLNRIESDTEVTKLREQIVQLEGERAEWASKITPAHPKMVAYDAQLSKLKGLLQSRLDRFGGGKGGRKVPTPDTMTSGSLFDFGLAGDVVNNQIKLEALNARYAALSGERAEIMSTLKNVPEQQLTYLQLKGDFDAAQEKVRTMQKRLDEATLMEAVSSNFTKVEVLKEPQLPKNPVRPDLMKNLLAATVLGLVFAVFAVFIRASMDKTLHWAHQLKGLAESGDKPVFTLPAQMPRELFRRMLEKTSHPVPDAYKRLIVHLENLSRQFGVRRIGLVPVSGEEGCAMPTVALSLYLTELGNKMVLIDTDFGRHSVTRLLSDLKLPVSAAVANGPGLSDYLSDGVEDFVDVIYPLGKTVYGSLIPTGSHASDVGFQFSQRNLSELEAQLSPNYDFVFYGLSSIEQSYDAIAVGRTLDGVLLLLQQGVTTVDQVQDAIRELEAVGTPVLGLLLQPLK